MTSMTSARTISDPVSQFQNLTRRVSKTQCRPKVGLHEKPKLMSPREEIYKSMIREIRNGSIPQMNSLVHKASGILRLAHYKEVNKNRKVTVSWDIDGRRVLTYENKTGMETSALQRQTNFDRKAKKNLLASLSEPIFGLDSQNLKALSEYVNPNYTTDINHNGVTTDGELPKNKVSKIWEDYIETGDVSKLWQSKEGILSSENPSLSASSAGLVRRQRSATSLTESEDRPPWKACYKASSSNFVISSRDRAHSMAYLPSMASPKRTNTDKAIQPKKSSVSQRNRTKSSKSSFTIPVTDVEKVDRIQHICVVNGSVVSFKNFGFENFTNWFGDESTLETNQQRCQPKIHQELDMTNVKNRDIKIRLLDGFKLEVTGRRRVPGTPKPIRVKEILLIPEGYRAEDLLMCRTKAGKLVVEEMTPEPIPAKSDHSKVKQTQSKAKWKTSRK